MARFEPTTFSLLIVRSEVTRPPGGPVGVLVNVIASNIIIEYDKTKGGFEHLVTGCQRQVAGLG